VTHSIVYIRYTNTKVASISLCILMLRQ